MLIFSGLFRVEHLVWNKTIRKTDNTKSNKSKKNNTISKTIFPKENLYRPFPRKTKII